MGWLVGWNSRKELTEHLQKLSPGYKLIDTGNTFKAFYMLVEVEATGERFIAVHLIDKRAKGTGGVGGDWGYKNLDESMGPCVYDCPLKLLDGSTCKDEGAIAWREACHKHHAAKRSHTLFIKNLKAGDLVQVGSQTAKIMYRYAKGWGRGKINGFVAQFDDGVYFARDKQIRPLSQTDKEHQHAC